MKVDLQVHTSFGSPDSKIERSDLPRLCRERGLDAVALTEHRLSSFSDIRLLMESEGLAVVPGREVSCRHAHLLVLCDDETLLHALTPLVPPDHPTLSDDAVAVVWAHPAASSGSSAYAPVIRRDMEVERILCGVEVLNGRHIHFPESVEAAESLVSETGLGATGGSDAHKDDDLGRCFTEVDCGLQDGTSALIQAIRSGSTRPVLSADWAKERGQRYRVSLSRYVG